MIGRWIERLEDELDLESVWLFGSRARGEDRGEESEVSANCSTPGAEA